MLSLSRTGRLNHHQPPGIRAVRLGARVPAHQKQPSTFDVLGIILSIFHLFAHFTFATMHDAGAIKHLSKVKGTGKSHTQTVRPPKFTVLTIKATLISISSAYSNRETEAT